MKTVETELEICEQSSSPLARAAGLSDSVLVRLSPLASPPQPLLAPVKFKAGLNFHLVNSFGNRAGSSVSVNISHSRSLGSLETNNHISFNLTE